MDEDGVDEESMEEIQSKAHLYTPINVFPRGGAVGLPQGIRKILKSGLIPYPWVAQMCVKSPDSWLCCTVYTYYQQEYLRFHLCAKVFCQLEGRDFLANPKDIPTVPGGKHW